MFIIDIIIPSIIPSDVKNNFSAVSNESWFIFAKKHSNSRTIGSPMSSISFSLQGGGVEYFNRLSIFFIFHGFLAAVDEVNKHLGHLFFC